MAGKSSKGGERLMTLRGNVWWFRQQVPDACRKVIGPGPRFLMVSLKTGNVVEAKRLRDELETVTRMQFRQIAGGRRTVLELPSWAVNRSRVRSLSPAERGVLARAALEAARDFPDLSDGDKYDRDSPEDLALFAAEQEAEGLRPAQRMAFNDSFAGRLEVDHHLNAFLITANLAPKTVNERRGLVGRFARWCREKGTKLDRVDRRTAGRYVTEVIDPMHPATQIKHLTALRTYWRFLAMRGYIDLPAGEPLKSGWPWNGQQVDKRGGRAERRSKKVKERPFTDEEVRKLLYSCFPMKQPAWELQIKDALRISLLSGMRLAEVLTLWVEDIHDGVFDIQEGKTEAAARKVPIHPELSELVTRRTEGKAPSDWLFQELRDERDPGDTFGKRFKRFREAVGVDDRREGVRRSLVNFHSARRWFATKADRADQREAVIKDVLGHVPDTKNVTRNAYIEPSSPEQMRRCIEAVSLPVFRATALQPGDTIACHG